MTSAKQKSGSVRNIALRQTWLEEQTEAVRSQYNYKSVDEAFPALAMSLVFSLDQDSIEPDEIVGGTGDKQVDIVRIEQDDKNRTANIHILQVKNTKGFGANTVIRIKNGLGWIFDKPQARYKKLKNAAFVNKIDEIRDLRKTYGAANLEIFVYYITKGDTADLSDEYQEEKSELSDKYSSVGFGAFEFREIGAFELIDYLNASEVRERQIDLAIPLVYDVNRPSLIQYLAGDTKAVVCTITGTTLATIASREPRDAIFDMNVRPFYGVKGPVNAEILSTCTTDESSRFWFLNNGITMVCKRLETDLDPDQPLLRVSGAQIVNGCQTTVTIREALESNSLKDDVRVLLKVFATDNIGLIERITLTTNNQNRVTNRDLRANDQVQIDIQRTLKEKFNFFYERKNRQYVSFRGDQRNYVVPNGRAAQAYLAIVRRKPSVARGYLLMVWSDYYQEIFENATAEDLLASNLIYRFCLKESRQRRLASYNFEYEVAVYGTFHLSRICGYLMTGDKWGGPNRELVAALIPRLSDENYMAANYSVALDILTQIRKKEQSSSALLYFKASEVQNSIEKALADRSAASKKTAAKKTVKSKK